ncbi:hypothetical protein SZ69_004738, partial [Escherichia coli]|nr:hypothetical protein [Escherichia coli]
PRQKQKKLIMLPSETMIWQPEFTDKTLSRKPGAVHDVRIIDFVDTAYPVLLRMWDKRQRGYKAMGYRIVADGEGLSF